MKTGEIMSKNKEKKSKTGIGKKILLVLIVIIVGINVRSILKSPGRAECREIITEFQTACNDLDVKGIVNCLNPSIANPLRVALFAGEVVTSRNSSEMLEEILDAVGGAGFFGLGSDLDLQSAFQSLKLTPEKYGLPKSVREIKCKADFEVEGLEFQYYVTIAIGRSHGEVYISELKFEE